MACPKCGDDHIKGTKETGYRCRLCGYEWTDPLEGKP